MGPPPADAGEKAADESDQDARDGEECRTPRTPSPKASPLATTADAASAAQPIVREAAAQRRALVLPERCVAAIANSMAERAAAPRRVSA